MIDKFYEDLSNNKKICFISNNCNFLENLYIKLKDIYKEKTIKLYTGKDYKLYLDQLKTHGEYKKEEYKNIEASFSVDILLYTTTITCGVSFERKN